MPLRLEDLSPFGQLAVKLDGHFSELTRISGQLDRLDIESDSGLEHAIRLLNQFAQHGQEIGESMKSFSQVLQQAHAQSGAAAKAVEARAQEIQRRKLHQDEIQQKFSDVEQKVKRANEQLSGFRSPHKKEFSEEERTQIASALGQLHGQLETFVREVETIRGEAGQNKFRKLERDATSLLDVLKSTQKAIE
jgi:ABC-type transporter Mla subunit MlaD